MDLLYENEIKRLTKENGYVVLSKHAQNEADKDGLEMDDLIAAINNGKTIEDYPTKTRSHECLIYGWSKGRPIHIVCRIIDDDIFIVTTYIPDTEKWHNDYETRRKRC